MKSFDYYLIERANGCIEWRGATVKSNRRETHRYGRFTRDGVKKLAHRVAFERVNGPIPNGLEVLHRCDNTLCCNPNHLFLGTHADNMKDMADKGRAARISRPGKKGESSPKVKLTDAQVSEIKSRRAAGENVTVLAAAYGVHYSYISRLARGVRR
jgi:hypothetical protein